MHRIPDIIRVDIGPTHTILQQKSSDYLPISSTDILAWPRPPGSLATLYSVLPSYSFRPSYSVTLRVLGTQGNGTPRLLSNREVPTAVLRSQNSGHHNPLVFVGSHYS